MPVCKHCHLSGEGKYCSHWGEIYQATPITIPSILHEVLHTFTHTDKGILHTLKNLALHPAIMQRNYLEGERKTNQKPFSLFFICGSMAAIVLHFMHVAPQGYQNTLDIAEVSFYRNYYVILQAVLLPYYALLAWTIFYHRNFTYAEALVLFIYSLAFSLLIIIPINFLGYFFHFINEQLAELIVLGIYMIWTNINFFRNEKKWVIILKSLVLLIACYGTSNFMTHKVIKFMS